MSHGFVSAYLYSADDHNESKCNYLQSIINLICVLGIGGRVSMSIVIGTPSGTRFVVRQSTRRDTKSDAFASDYRVVIIVMNQSWGALTCCKCDFIYVFIACRVFRNLCKPRIIFFDWLLQGSKGSCSPFAISNPLSEKIFTFNVLYE